MQLRAARTVIAVPVVAACALAGASIAASASPPPGPPQLTGTHLASALLPATAFPHGYSVTGRSSSGRHLETGAARYHLGVMTCGRFAATTGRTGFGETAAASDDRARLFGGFSSGSGESFRQMVYQFANPGAARTYFRGLQAIAGKCGAWRLAGTGSESGLLSSAWAGADGETFQVGASVSTQASEAQEQSVVVLNGADVIEVDAASVNRGLPASPALDALAHQLIVRVRAAR